MDHVSKQEYFYAMLEIRSEEQIFRIDASAYPHTKSEYQDKKYKELVLAAFPEETKAGKKLKSTKDLARVFKYGR